MNKNSGKRIKMSLYTVGTLFRKGRKNKGVNKCQILNGQFSGQV